MANREDLKAGDNVKHRFRENKYQDCTIIEVEEGCNGLIKVICEGVESTFCPQDLAKIKNK